MGYPGGSSGKESACNDGDWRSIPGLGRSPGEENDYLLQYSCLKNPMVRGVWWAAVHGVIKSQTWLSNKAHTHTAAAKSLQSCPTLCDPTDGSPWGSPVPGVLQARTLEWVAISFSNAWKWKVKVKHSVMSDPQRPHGLQPTRLLHPWDFPGKSTGVGCHCLLHTHTEYREILSYSSSDWLEDWYFI